MHVSCRTEWAPVVGRFRRPGWRLAWYFYSSIGVRLILLPPSLASIPPPSLPPPSLPPLHHPSSSSGGVCSRASPIPTAPLSRAPWAATFPPCKVVWSAAWLFVGADTPWAHPRITTAELEQLESGGLVADGRVHGGRASAGGSGLGAAAAAGPRRDRFDCRLFGRICRCVRRCSASALPTRC